MRTIQSGGQTVKTSHYDGVEWAKSPSKFEGGLGHFAGMMATGAAIDYLTGLNMMMSMNTKFDSIRSCQTE